MKTGGGGIRVWRFMSSFSHTDNGLKTWETVGLDVFWRDGADLTDASGFNGVEQCEKGLSRRNSKVHHATFIQIALCFFSPSHHYFLVFLLVLFSLSRSEPRPRDHFLPLPALFWCPYKYLQAIHPLAYLLNWVRLHTLKPRVPPSPQQSSFASIMRPHKGTDLVTYFTPAITIVLIRFHLFLLKHVWWP